MDVKGLKIALPVCFKSDVTMLIVGPHGVGKSQGVRQAVEGEGIGKVWDFRLGQMADTGDIIGLLDVESTKDYCTFKMPERIHQVVEYCNENPDKFGVMFFDEMNRTTKDILQAIFQIVLDHELNGMKFPKNMKAVCAINPATDDYSVLDFDDKAFADRFCHVRFQPSVRDWLEYARSKEVDSSITGFIGENNEMLKAPSKDFKLDVEPSPRSWFAVDRIKKVCNNKGVFQELLMGIVGNEAAHMYIDYSLNFDDAIKGIEVLDDYSKCRAKIQRFANVNSDRTDLLRNVCDQIKVELEKVEMLNNDWENNLADFLCDIPRDLGKGFINELFDVPAFLKSENDEEYGLTGANSEAGKKVFNQYSQYANEESSENSEETTEE